MTNTLAGHVFHLICTCFCKYQRFRFFSLNVSSAVQAMSAFLWYATLVIASFLAAVQIYACYHFKAIQYLLIIQKRYPKLILTEAVAVLVWLLTALPLWSNFLFEATTYGMTPKGYDSFLKLEVTLISPIVHFIYIIEVCRLWLISFNLHFLHSSQNQKWKTQIDASFAQKDWYLKHRDTFGNEQYLVQRAFIYYSFVAIEAVSVYLITLFIASDLRWLWIANFNNGILFLISTSMALYIYYKCRDYHMLNDNLYFWWEIRTTAAIWLTTIVCYFVVQSLYFFFSNATAPIVTPIISSLFVVIGIFSMVAPSLLSTLVIPRKILQSGIWGKESFHEINSTNSRDIDPDSLTDLLHQTLQNEEKFELFVQWMNREFSSEAALCFIEMVQFKQCFIDYIKQKNGSFSHDYDTKYIDLLYDTVPKSSIVFVKITDHVGIAKFKLIAHLLFDKYIRANAEFEVNISHQLRAKYTKLDEQNWNMKQDEFVLVFEKIVEEMFSFMWQSFDRYYQPE